MSLTAVILLLSQVLAPANSAPAPSAAPPRAAKIDALAWLAGHWTASSPDGESSEELWIAPKAGLMVGLNRGVSHGRASFEYLRIEQRKDDVVYVASPGGGPSTDFRLTSSVENSATFENPAHDFPKRIVYRRDGSTLTARVDAGPSAPNQGMDLRWTLADR